jgi:ribosomal protein S18 acetylase RimI-like enzyme
VTVVRAVPTVVPLAASAWPTAGDCLARAFDPDPIWQAVFPDPARRAPALRSMFRGLARLNLRYGRPLATDDTTAVALWRPPGAAPRLWDTLATRAALPRAVAAFHPVERHRLLRTLRQFDGRRAALVPQPHWYLESIGVEPALQGRGLGTALLAPVLAEADAAGVPAYLETETEDNVRFYQRLGFVVAEEEVADALQVPVWLMVRPPGGAG